jgi:hypothetical protein
MIKKRKNFISLNLNIHIKNCNTFIPRPPGKMPKLQEKPSALKTLQNMKSSLFSFLWVFLPSGSSRPKLMSIRIPTTLVKKFKELNSENTAC